MNRFPIGKVVSYLTLLVVFLGASLCAQGQCPSFTFSAAAGPTHRKITLTIGGQINGTAQIQRKDANGQWQDEFFTNGTGNYPIINLGHNQTIEFRAQNGGSCTGWIEASATTFDVGEPWLKIWPGPGYSMYVQSGAVSPDMNSAVLLSTTGVEPFTLHSVWQTLPPNVAAPQQVFIFPNVTYYLYAQIDLGGETRRTEIYMVRLSPDQDYGSCRGGLNVQIMPSTMVGDPVNTINGNMFLSHTDYRLPGIGNSIDITRSYNSLLQNAGLFGLGWTTQYDQYLTFIDSKNIRLQMPDGRGIYFAEPTPGKPLKGITPGFPGELSDNGDGTFTLEHRDGRFSTFDSTGALIWEQDRLGNQTTLNYDTSGELTGVTDAFGRTLSITIGSNGFVSQISDAVGVVATYDYFPSSNLLKKVTFPDGSKYQFEYDTTSAAGKTLLKTVKDALNNVIETHLYDSQGRATTSERATIGGVAQNKYTLDYSNSAYTTVTDGLGRETKYHFDKTGSRNVIKKIEGLCGCGGGGSETTEYVYDSHLNLVKKTDALLRDTTYTYDEEQNITSITDVLGTQTFTHDGYGQVMTYKDRVDSSGSNNTVTNTYDWAGNLLTTTDRLGHTTTMTYTSSGQLETVTDARSNTTTFSYDSQGRLIEVTDANNKDTTFGYDARARVTSVTNAKNETTAFEYDLNNRLRKVTFPDTNYTENTYDLAGRRTQFRNPRGFVTNFAYDGAYRLSSVTGPINQTFGYDAMSNLTSQTDALGNTTNFEYDDFNRLKKTIYPPATTGATRLEESVTYDQLGNVKTRVDSAGRTTAYDYDNLNRLIKITDALTNQTHFEYNLRSQMTKVKDALNQEYVFTYDPIGRVLTQTRAGTTMTFEYDAVGNRTKRTDHNGTVTNYTYDNLNRLTSGSLGTYTYDDVSQMLTATNANGTVSFTYDNRGRVDTTTDVHGKVIDSDYDANGNRTLTKLDGVNYARYTYDSADRLSALHDFVGSRETQYAYDVADRLTQRRYPNGQTSLNAITTYAYDGMSRLTQLRSYRGAATLVRLDYTYSNANQISQIVEPSRTRTFTYDNIDRLTAATDSLNGSESYSYDPVGNRTASHWSSSYTYNPFNRLTATQTTSHAYDNNGAMTSRTDTNGTINFVHDSDGRMLQAYSNPLDPVEYKYDALGRRVSSKQPGQTAITYTFDGDDVMLSNSSAGLSKFINGPGIDNKLSARIAGTSGRTFYLGDHLGTTYGTANDLNQFTPASRPDSFGNFSTDFTGREYDTFTGLYYYRARMYDPKLGRFISEDPIGFDGGDVNLFGYVNNSPTNRTDPYGLLDRADFARDLEMARQATQGISPAVGAGGGALLVAGAKVGGVAVGGFAAGYAIGYYPGQWSANSPYNPLVYGPLNPFGTPYNPYAGPMPQPQASSSSKPGPSCQPATQPPPFYQSPPFSNPFDKPDENRDRDICGRVLSLCLRNPRQPKWNQKQYGKRKDCGACNRECRQNGGAWPFEKCPIPEF